MSQKAVIQITSTQTYEGGTPDIMLQTVSGVISVKPDGIQLAYQESKGSGLEGTLTRISVQPDKITLTRTGTVQSKMVFEEGVRHVTKYRTAYGVSELGVFTHALDSTLDEWGGELFISYSLDMDGEPMGDNTISLQIGEP